MVRLSLATSNPETMTERVGDPLVFVGRTSFGRNVKEERPYEMHFQMHEPMEANAFALYMNGDGSATFLECEAQACEPGRSLSMALLPEELYRVRFVGSNSKLFGLCM